MLLALALLMAACTVMTQKEVPELERRATALNKTIMCPVCPGESIDQSQNSLAVQMRAIAYEKLAGGASEQQVQDFFVERYGPSVLLEPPTRGFGLSAWIVPPAAFALAAAALLLTLRWMRMSSSAAANAKADGGDTGHSGYLARLEKAVEPRSSAPNQRAESEGDDGAGERGTRWS